MPASRVRIDLGACNDILTAEGMRNLLNDAGAAVAVEAARYAPKLTGEGAKSIHHWLVVGRGGRLEARVSWDHHLRYYMSFHELGTVNLPARPFLRPALYAARL